MRYGIGDKIIAVFITALSLYSFAVSVVETVNKPTINLCILTAFVFFIMLTMVVEMIKRLEA